MQIVERPWGVTVYGTATVTAKPELARVRFNVSRLEKTPSQAFAAVSEMVGTVRQVLRQHGVPEEAVQRSELGLRTSWNHYGSGREVGGYLCAASFAVESGNLEDVQSLLADLVAAGAHEIDGIDFDVAAKDELRAEACRQAVDTARRKAGLYAEAAEVRLGAVLHIEDISAERHGGIYLAAAEGASSSSPEVLMPGHVVVSAAVIVGFAIYND